MRFHWRLSFAQLTYLSHVLTFHPPQCRELALACSEAQNYTELITGIPGTFTLPYSHPGTVPEPASVGIQFCWSFHFLQQVWAGKWGGARGERVVMANAYVSNNTRRQSVCDQFSHKYHAFQSGKMRWLPSELRLGHAKEQRLTPFLLHLQPSCSCLWACPVLQISRNGLTH